MVGTTRKAVCKPRHGTAAAVRFVSTRFVVTLAPCPKELSCAMPINPAHLTSSLYDSAAAQARCCGDVWLEEPSAMELKAMEASAADKATVEPSL